MLSHLKVIELASVLAGPDVGMFFSELGANVIKIENKLTDGDVTRKWKLPTENENSVSSYYSSVNWNKEILFLNLRDKKDKEKVYDLVKEADIVICNFKPGDAIKLQMDYNTVKSYNPSIIYGEINGYGSNSTRTAYDAVLQAETGYMSMNGSIKSGPIKLPIAFIDILAAHQMKEGLLLALHRRVNTGKGAFVEVSLYDTAISSLKNQATNWLMNQYIPYLEGSLHPNIAPYGEIFTTKNDLQIVLAIGSDKQFLKLLQLLNANKITTNKKYLTNQLRVDNRQGLANDLAPYFRLYNREDLMKKFIKNNVPAGAVYNLEEVFKNKEAQKLVLNEKIEDTGTKRVKTAIFKIT